MFDINISQLIVSLILLSRIIADCFFVEKLNVIQFIPLKQFLLHMYLLRHSVYIFHLSGMYVFVFLQMKIRTLTNWP